MFHLQFTRGGSRTAETTKMERFVITVNGWQLLGCCSSPRSATVLLKFPLSCRSLPAGIYLLKVNNENIGIMCDVVLVFLLSTLNRFHTVLMFPLLTLNKQIPAGLKFNMRKPCLAETRYFD